MKYKKICLLTFIVTFLISAICINVYAEDDISYCCGTAPEFIQETHKALVQKKQAEINQEINPWDNSITLYSQIPSIGTLKLMPSTGDVRALVVTVSFPNAPISNERFEKLKD